MERPYGSADHEGAPAQPVPGADYEAYLEEWCEWANSLQYDVKTDIFGPWDYRPEGVVAEHDAGEDLLLVCRSGRCELQVQYDGTGYRMVHGEYVPAGWGVITWGAEDAKYGLDSAD